MGCVPASALGKSQPPISLAGPGEWPAVRSGGQAVNPEGEGQQSHGEADGAGRSLSKRRLTASGIHVIDVSEAKPPQRQAASGPERLSLGAV